MAGHPTVIGQTRQWFVLTGNKRWKISETPDLIVMSDYDIKQP
jgi:hypothetical protein